MSFEIAGVGWDMAAASIVNRDVLRKLTPGGESGLAQLTDDELLANTRRLVGKTNQLLAALLVHLAEVEARGAHRKRRCASLYTYCIYELRFSEDAAARRSAAARLVKQFPALLEAIADGELHLTGLLMIGPHLTPENQLEVLGRAKFRTKKELGKLVRELNPLPPVPDCIEPLGPSLPHTPRSPTWAEFAASLCPPVRELPAGERPRDWANDGVENAASAAAPLNDREALPVGPVPADLPPVTGPQHYQIQFSTVEEHVQLIERAKALLAREKPGATLGELHLEAMKMLVAALEKRKFAVTERPRQPNVKSCRLDQRAPSEAPRQRGEAEQRELAEAPRQRGGAEQGELAEAPRRPVGPEAAQSSDTPRGRTRHIPAAERREVYRRDGGRCAYVDARGERCGETRYLELHHLQPFARQGMNLAANLALRCRAHNQLAAEQDFGPELIAKKRASLRHEALHTQLDMKPKG